MGNNKTVNMAEKEQNKPMSAFIIGSLSQESQIKEIAEILSHKINVSYVHKEEGVNLASLISNAFDNIDKADIIIALGKSNGDIGDGTLYELEYAKRMNKKIYVINVLN